MVPDAQAATPFLGWKQPRRDSVSARKLAASLWHLSAACQCRLSFDRFAFQFCSSLPIPNLEGATKWDLCDDFQSGKHVNEVQRNGMRKMDEMRMRKEEQSMTCSAINNLAKGVRSERRICKNIDKMNSRLLRDIGDAKLSAMKLIWSLRREKKAREELEGACYDLARESEAIKAEIWALRDEQERIELEVEEERKMLQVAEVWREEQAQMKLADANFILEDKYAEVNGLIADLKAFLTSSNAEILRQAFNLVINQGVEHSIPESDNAFAATEDAQTSGAERRSGGDTEMSNFNAASTRNEISLVQAEVKTSKGDGNSDRSRGSRRRRNPHVVRAMKGHIEWPWRMPRRLEANLDSRKMLLRHKA